MAPKKPKATDTFEDKAQPKPKGKAKAKGQPAKVEVPEPFSPASEPHASVKNQQSSFVATLKRENAGDSEEMKKSKKEVLDCYEGLALRDPKKREIVNKWLSDRSLSWKNEFIRTSETETAQVRTKAAGHLTIYEVAKKLSLDPEVPAQKELLDKVLEEYDQDDDWDESDPYERGCKKAGLKRIHFSKKELSKEKTTQREKTTLLSSKDTKPKFSMVESGEGESQSSDLSLKIKNPEYHALKIELDILTSGEVRLSEAITEMKKILPRLRMCQNSDDRVEECLKVQKSIEEMQDKILTFTFSNEKIKAEDAVEGLTNDIEEAKARKDAIKLHELFKLLQKKVQAYIAAQ